MRILIWFFGKCRLVVILQDKTYVYDINSLGILDTIDTIPNLKGETGSYFFLYQYVDSHSVQPAICLKTYSYNIIFCPFFFHSPQGFVHSLPVWKGASWLFLLASPRDLCCCTMSWTCIYIVRLWNMIFFFIHDRKMVKYVWRHFILLSRWINTSEKCFSTWVQSFCFNKPECSFLPVMWKICGFVPLLSCWSIFMVLFHLHSQKYAVEEAHKLEK